jgi:hypothetical protein
MPRVDALDTMKALGLTVIVYGHVAHATTVALVPPIYVKQFGVAFFLFAAAFALARERRSPADALVRRLRPIYGYGLALALLLTVIGAVRGTGLALSNYLPFAAGINVVRDAFPVNPTTWYIGTYIHALLLWAVLLRRVVVPRWAIAAAIVIEIPVRAALMQFAGHYVAYMLLTNWASVLLLGFYCGARERASEPHDAAGAAGFAALLVVVLAASAGVFWNLLPTVPTFPFMTLAPEAGWTETFIVAAGTSWLYLVTTVLVFAAAKRLPAPALATFLSRNSLVVFLAHMPLYYALTPVLTGLGLGYWPRALVQFVIGLFGLALLSEAIRAVLPPLPALRYAAVFPWGSVHESR